MKLNLEKPLVFFDLETTGLDFKDKIIEVSLVKIHPSGAEETYTVRINPEIPIPPASTAVHGITDDMVKDSPTFKEIAPSLLEFLQGCDLAGYNSSRFDLPMLDEEFARVGIRANLQAVRHIDVQNIYHKMERRTLEAAFRFYCHKTLENAHSAEADAYATYEVLKAQLDEYPDVLENNVDALADFSKLQDNVDLAGRIIRNQKGENVFNFGKYKGIRVLDVHKKDPGYYRWILDGDFSFDTKSTVNKIILLGEDI